MWLFPDGHAETSVVLMVHCICVYTQIRISISTAYEVEHNDCSNKCNTKEHNPYTEPNMLDALTEIRYIIILIEKNNMSIVLRTIDFGDGILVKTDVWHHGRSIVV